MTKQLYGAYYPKCSSTKRCYLKHEMINGVITVQNKNLIFQQKVLLLFPLKSNYLSLPLNEVDYIETMNLNGILPFGVCVFMKNKKEYMFGHINQQKLKNFIEEYRLIN